MILFGQILAEIAAAALIPVALAAMYRFVLACYSLLPDRISGNRVSGRSARIAVVVYARNAENEIAAVVRRLIDGMDYERSKFEVVVLADACDDSTAYVASFNGAKVLERRNEWKIGYAHALEWALPQLLADGFDAVLALDADCVLLPNTLAVVDSAISAGYRAIRIPLIPAAPSAFQADLGYAAKNRVDPKGRSKAGFSCGLTLPGLCLERTLLEAVPFVVDERGDVGFYDAKLLFADEPIAFPSKTAALHAGSADSMEEPPTIPAGRLLKAAFDGNYAALERLFAGLIPKASTILAALLVVSLTAGILVFAGARFPRCAELAEYGRALLIATSASAVLLLFHLLVATFTWHSDSILRKAVGNLNKRMPTTG